MRASEGIRRRPARTLLTSLGLGLATALVVTLLALSAGIQENSSRLATASGIDLLATSGNTSLTGGSFPPVTGAHGLPSAFRSADPNVATASPWMVSSLVYANQSLWQAANASAVPAGWDPAEENAVGWIPDLNTGLETPAIVNGSDFSMAGDPHWANGSYTGPETHEMVVDQNLADLLHLRAGDLLWASSQPVSGPTALSGWFANATAFRVVGISGPFWLLPSVGLGFLYLSELQSLLGSAATGPDLASLVLVHLVDPTLAATDQSRLASAFPALNVFTVSDVLGAIQHVVDLYRTFGTLVGALAVIVAGLFATTVLMMNVDDRSREIAVERALGVPRRTVAASVLLDALVLGVIGFAIGLPFGYLGATAIDGYLRSLLPGLPHGFSFVAFSPGVIGLGLAEVLGVGLLAAIAPVARALSLPIAEELRAP